MFDFRYHALSLVAVFIALAVGLLLGVAIGDKELVSSAKNDLRDSLRDDVRKANGERDDARADLAREKEFVDEAYPILTGQQLRERRIGIVLLGGESKDTVRNIRDALEPTGAEIELVAVVDKELDLADIGKRAEGTRYEKIATDKTLLGPFGRRIGAQMVDGGKLVGETRPALLSSLSGGFGALNGIVVVRTQPDEGKTAAEKQEAEELRTLQDGIANGLADTARSVAGVERSDTDPSQISWYRDRGLSTIDNLNEDAGQAALVYVLAGAEGAYGRKDSAQALLPTVVVTPSRQVGTRERSSSSNGGGSGG